MVGAEAVLFYLLAGSFSSYGAPLSSLDVIGCVGSYCSLLCHVWFMSLGDLIFSEVSRRWSESGEEGRLQGGGTGVGTSHSSGCQMVQQGKAPATKPGDLSSIPASHTRRETNPLVLLWLARVHACTCVCACLWMCMCVK